MSTTGRYLSPRESDNLSEADHSAGAPDSSDNLDLGRVDGAVYSPEDALLRVSIGQRYRLVSEIESTKPVA